jgi:UDP:flavonoid glycosyltransferase YjiC (YdhE family)
MRITILTIGSRGDVVPYLALGKGLGDAGLDVRMATHARFESMVRDIGLEYLPVVGDPRDTLEGEAGQRWLEAGKSTLSFTKRMMDASESFAWQVLDDYWRASQDSDAILFPPLAALPAFSILEKLRIPGFPAYLQHIHPSWSYPSAMAMPLPALGGIYNRLTYPLVGQLFWQSMRSLINRWRVRTLGLPPYSWKGPFHAWQHRRIPCFYGFSPSVIPKPREWGDEVHITGYWSRETPADWQPDPALVDFVESGSAPVFVGFGSMTGRDPKDVTGMIVEALARSGQRGVLLSGWSGLGGVRLPDDVLQLDSAPFDWLFPRMAAVVHHGGAGTTGSGLRAGVPSIVVPFFGDQFFWGWRVEDLGAGPKPISRKRLSVERLAAAIRRSVDDKEMRRRAAALGERIRCEDGVAAAVEAITSSLEQRKPQR